MTAPTYAWTVIPDTDVDPNSPWDTDVATALVHNMIHLEEWLGHSYTAERDHDHDGVNSAVIMAGVTPNFIVNALPQADADEGWVDSAGVGMSSESGWEWTGAASENLYQIIGYSAQNKEMFGTSGTVSTAGNDWVVSFFAKADSVPSAGTLAFGFADGSLSSFISGCRADIPGTSLSTAWKRFWMKVTDKGSNAGTDFRLLLRTTSTISVAFHTSGFMVHIGDRLMNFAMGPMELSDHDGYARLSDDVPVWDKSIAMTNAVQITPV